MRRWCLAVVTLVSVARPAAATESIEGEVAKLLATTRGLHAEMPDASEIRDRTRGADERYYSFGRNDPLHGIGRPSYYVAGQISTGQRVILVPLYSGGTQSIIYALVYASVHEKMAFIGYIPSPGHMRPSIASGYIVIGTDAYVRGDRSPYCCPKHEHYEYYTLRGYKLVKVRDEVVENH
jgi:hypothetical protein